MRPISEVATSLGLDPAALIPQGHFKAKIPLEAIRENGTRGKMVIVTGITPTPAGEGKTTTTVGLAQAMGRMGLNVAATLREPSMGPIFGIKGGGTGGGLSLVEPQDEVNVHFTGDAHAVGSAHNLLSALTDNAAQRGQVSGFRPGGITWRRVMDIEDRALRSIVAGLGGSANAPLRETGFDIVTASEIMAVLALSRDLNDLRERLSRIVVGYRGDDSPVTAKEVNAVGSLMALLRYAILPNLVQTTEGQPVIVHAGPFGNIAHGCSSVVGDLLALGYADYVLSEAGFGADLGFEKFMHIKARSNGLEPCAAVLVATVRAVKYHGGVAVRELEAPDTDAVRRGLENLTHLIGVVRAMGLPVVVAINHFPSDTRGEMDLVKRGCEDAGAFAAVESRVFSEGGAGGMELAGALVQATEGPHPEIAYFYPEDASIQDKVLSLARTVYNANDVNWSAASLRQLRRFEANGWGALPVCMAKTHSSISHQSSLRGKPSGYTFEINDVRASVGAGFIYPVAGSIVTMPGLPSSPRTLDVDAAGNILNL